MAVSKMSKLTLIAQQEYSEQIMSAIQGFQGLEVGNLFERTVSNDWMRQFFDDVEPLSSQDGLSKIDSQLEQIENAIRFIEHHGSSHEKVQHLKRQKTTLRSLEADFQETELQIELMNVQELQKRFLDVHAKKQEAEEQEALLQKWYSLDILPQKTTLHGTQIFLGTTDVNVWELLEEQMLDCQTNCNISS